MARAPVPKLSLMEREWRAQDDLRTLTAADSIRGDKQRMGAVQQHAQKQMATLARVAPVKPAAAKPAAKPARK